MQHKGIEVLEFNDQSGFVEWLKTNYKTDQGYWLRLLKKGSKKKGINYVEAREAAIMYGWIDGLVNKYDDDYFFVRFTHRRPKSIWSKINRDIAINLIESGRIHSEGMKEAEKAKNDGRWDAAY